MEFKEIKQPKKFIKEKLKGEQLRWAYQNKYGVDFNYGIDVKNRVAAIYTWEFVDNTYNVSIIPEKRRVVKSESDLEKMYFYEEE